MSTSNPRPRPPVHFNRRASDNPDRESERYPDAQWPLRRFGDRVALLRRIEEDLGSGLLDPIAAYHERLHWAYRCMKEGV